MVNVALMTIVWSVFALLIYSYIAYPILMARIARHTKTEKIANCAADVTASPTVAVIVAAFNEEMHIAVRIANLLQQDYPSDQLRILIGSDGSTDRTVELASEISDARLTVYDFSINRGKASVLNDLVAQSNADILVFTDANTVFRLDTIRQLVLAFDRNTGAVCGDLILEGQRHGSNQDHQYWNFERRLKFAESSIGGLLGANGGVYAVRREYFQPLPPDTICDDFVIAMNIAVAGHWLKYAPEAVAYEEIPSDVAAEFHRRVRIGIGNYQALFRHPRYLFSGSWALGYTYFSHKILRWLTPHLLVLLLICCFLLFRDPLYKTLAVMQLMGYSAATLVFIFRNHIAWPAAIRTALLFAVLNLAFLVGFMRFVTRNYRGGWRRTERA